MLARFILYLPVWFIGTFILTWPIVPVAVLLADKDGRLPRLFKWWETHDNLGWDGIYEESTVIDRFSYWLPKVGLWWARRITLTTWLWRNKAYTLRYNLGMRLDEYGWTITKVRGREEHRKIGPSYLYVVGEANGKRFFEFQPSLGIYWLRVRPKIELYPIRIYARIGWKLSGLLDGVNGGSSGIYTGITPRKKS